MLQPCAFAQRLGWLYRNGLHGMAACDCDAVAGTAPDGCAPHSQAQIQVRAELLVTAQVAQPCSVFDSSVTWWTSRHNPQDSTCGMFSPRLFW